MYGDIPGICFSLLRIKSFFLLLLVMGPLYSSSFNPNLILVLLWLDFDLFGLVSLLSFVSEGFLFILIGLRSDMTFLNLLGSRMLLSPDCIIDVIFFVDCSIQFLRRANQPGEKSYIVSKNVGPNFIFSVHSTVWSPKMLMLESVRT
jgi:hypothetical protein